MATRKEHRPLNDKYRSFRMAVVNPEKDTVEWKKF
mgnify:FL=1